VIQWSEKDDCFLVSLPDFPCQKWRSHGHTYEEAVRNGKEALESLIISYQSDGEPVPEPNIYAVQIPEANLAC
jgi:antitoxin HicB